MLGDKKDLSIILMLMNMLPLTAITIHLPACVNGFAKIIAFGSREIFLPPYIVVPFRTLNMCLVF